MKWNVANQPAKRNQNWNEAEIIANTKLNAIIWCKVLKKTSGKAINHLEQSYCKKKHKPVKVYKKLKQCLYEQEYCYFKWVSRKSSALEILNMTFFAG